MARRTQALGGQSAFLGGAVYSKCRSGGRGFAKVLVTTVPLAIPLKRQGAGDGPLYDRLERRRLGECH
jgi:hypothetical protein